MNLDELSRSLLENDPHPITAINPDTSIMYVNPAFEKLTGFSLPEIIGRQAPYPWWPQKTWSKRLPDLKKLMAGANKTIEHTIQNRNGESFLVQLKLVRVVEKGISKYHLAYWLDITERKRAEEALIESEEKYRTLVEDALIGIMNVDLTGKITYVNNTIVHDTGYSREELIGKNVFRLGLVTSEMLKVLRKRMKEKLTGQPPGLLQLQFKCKDGRWIWIQIRGKVIRKHNIPVGIQIFGEEIIERKQAEEALRESEEFSTSLLENSPDPIVVINPDTSIRYANPALENLTGFSRAEVTDKKAPYPWWTEETLKKTNRDLKEAMHKGAKGLKELFQKKNGERFWVEITSAPVISDGRLKYYMANWVDITERKKAEEALRESEEKFSKAFRASPDVVSIATLKDGRYIEVNDSFTQITGYSRKEVIGRTTIELNTWATAGERERMIRMLLEKGHIRNEEFAARSKSGKIQNVLISAEVIDIGGEPCIIAVSTDITERREAEEKLREAANLRELDRLRTELLANISHELRTPLSSIKGFATVLLEYGDKLKRHEKREYLETIDKNTDRLVELIEQLLDMSRLGAGMLSIEKSPTSISKLFQEVLAEVQVRAPAHRFTLDLPARLPKAHIDARRIRQVLDNLTDNAIKHSRAGTEITIHARKKGDEILVAVIDQGTGIPKNILPRVFERLFSSGKSHVSGTSGIGLGLSICKGLVEAHGGRIWIESEEGKGTICFFILPIYQRPGNSHGRKRQG